VFYTGIDQHKHSSVVTTLTASGEQLAQVTLPNRRPLLRHYFAQFPGPHQAVVEATGRWYWLRDLLMSTGVELQLAHAKLLKAIAYAKVKTDAVDSHTLAQLLRVGLIPRAHMISETRRGPRDVLRTRLQLVERRIRCDLSVGSLLEKFNVPEVAQLPPLYQLQAQLHTAQAGLLDAQVHELEQAIQGDLLDTPAIQRLLWIPGIGRLLAFTLYLEIDDIQRFPDVRHFWSYCAWCRGRPTRRVGSGIGPARTATAISSWRSATRPCGPFSISLRCGSGFSGGSGRNRPGWPGRWWPRSWRRACTSCSRRAWSSTTSSRARR